MSQNDPLYIDLNAATGAGLCAIRTGTRSLNVGDTVFVRDEDTDTFPATVLELPRPGEALIRIDFGDSRQSSP